MTTRAAVLAVIVCALVLALAYPIRAYFGQRADIRRLEQARAAAQSELDGFQKQRSMWDDPGYVEAQARERLRYVRPGEKSLIVTGPAPTAAAAPAPAADAPAAGTDSAWYERLWSTVEIAGTSPRGKAASPPAR